MIRNVLHTGVGTPGWRVFFVGVLVPVHWVVLALFAAWVRVAAWHPGATRAELADEVVGLVLDHPWRSLGSVPLALFCLPILLIAPITIAVGLSLPGWLFSRHWAVGAATAPLTHQS